MSLKRTANVSKEQKQQLICFVEEHPELVRGKFTNEFTFKCARNLWQEVQNNLNALPGATKTWQQWRKTWHDLKTTTKSKKSNIVKLRQQTGGGSPPKESFDETEEKILSIIGPTSISGHSDVLESEVLFTFKDVDKENYKNNFNMEEEVVVMGDLDVRMEHTYSIPSVTQTLELEHMPSPTSPIVNMSGLKKVHNMSDIKNMSSNDTPSVEKKVTTKRNSRLRRLENTISATEKLAEQTERRNNIKEKYYAKKIELYEAEVEAQTRIANALEQIASNY